mmetsp:Transcript_8000/g.7194  ORF Transcript_8000/g.7194 Transcript_8000/m.7194 type:complete len:202 (-) Transcript_8000:162-767(-)
MLEVLTWNGNSTCHQIHMFLLIHGLIQASHLMKKLSKKLWLREESSKLNQNQESFPEVKVVKSSFSTPHHSMRNSVKSRPEVKVPSMSNIISAASSRSLMASPLPSSSEEKLLLPQRVYYTSRRLTIHSHLSPSEPSYLLSIPSKYTMLVQERSTIRPILKPLLHTLTIKSGHKRNFLTSRTLLRPLMLVKNHICIACLSP